MSSRHEVVTMAKSIIDGQQAEVDHMKRLLDAVEPIARVAAGVTVVHCLQATGLQATSYDAEFSRG
jgi:hypothetical protein